VAYYERRAKGGCGTIVVEGASVHESDWPYERAPLAERAGEGWAAIAAACGSHGALVVASLDHAGGQGSSAYSQAPLWAPSRVPEVVTREVPKWMEPDDIEAVVAGFGAAAVVAREAGCDGVEVNAGQHSLVRQFLSGLTNHREDDWGADRLRFAREVIRAVRAAVGPARVVGLRLSGDELAPWAGITPEMAPDIATALVAEGVDYVVVVRGAIFSAEQTRPDFHQPVAFNAELAEAVAGMVGVPVIVQGSVVDPTDAERVLDGRCAGVEMTRAQIADPDLVAKLRAGAPRRIRPCTRCNQTCQVRDARNPIVTCIGEPTSGHETDDPDWYRPATTPRSVVVVGGGPAGLEAARVAAIRGHSVTLVDRAPRLGGLAAAAGPNGPLVEWLAHEVERHGVDVRLGTADVPAGADAVVQCTGSIAGFRDYAIAVGAAVLDVADVRRGAVEVPADGDVVVFDPIGGPIGVAFAEEIGARAVLVTQDHIAGNELSRTGDLAPANARLARAGVRVERRTLLREVRPSEAEVEDRFTGARRTIPCVAVVDCGFRLPDAPLPGATAQAGDCVAPRTVHEAVLEARRAVLEV
jgi:2,4-dienoyl-CoA reductase (NADPH2)